VVDAAERYSPLLVLETRMVWFAGVLAVRDDARQPSNEGVELWLFVWIDL
jgi:hypothetical protein